MLLEVNIIAILLWQMLQLDGAGYFWDTVLHALFLDMDVMTSLFICSDGEIHQVVNAQCVHFSDGALYYNKMFKKIKKNI